MEPPLLKLAEEMFSIKNMLADRGYDGGCVRKAAKKLLGAKAVIPARTSKKVLGQDE